MRKILLSKSCLAKFEKRLSMLCEQLLKSKSINFKNKLTNTALLKKIELYVLRFGRWAKIVQQPVYFVKRLIKCYPITNCNVVYTTRLRNSTDPSSFFANFFSA